MTNQERAEQVIEQINQTNDFRVEGHCATCSDVALENLWINAIDAGAWPVDGSSLQAWDIVWDAVAADLVIQYLQDGTATCYCD